MSVKCFCKGWHLKVIKRSLISQMWERKTLWCPFWIAPVDDPQMKVLSDCHNHDRHVPESVSEDKVTERHTHYEGQAVMKFPNILSTLKLRKRYYFGFTSRGGGGATRMARGGIRLVHGLTKSTLITYYLGMKKDPKYAFLHAFFLICLSCSFQNLSIWPKTHPFFQFYTFLHP